MAAIGQELEVADLLVKLLLHIQMEHMFECVRTYVRVRITALVSHPSTHDD